MTPKKKPRGLRVMMRINFVDPSLVVVNPIRGEMINVCYSWLHRAGLKPLKPGESRIVTVRIEDK